MSGQDQSLPGDEQRVLRFLEKCDGRRFSLEQLAKGSDLEPEMAEKTLLSLEKQGFIDIKMPGRQTETGEVSLAVALFSVRELLDRLSKLKTRRESTKAAVFERVKDRLNEELSSAIANLEYAADRTHDRLLHLEMEIEDSRDRIEEARLSCDIGEISREEGDERIHGFESKIAELEAQRKEVLAEGFEPPAAQASKKTWAQDERRRLKSLLEELEVRKQVGEFDGREGEFDVEKERILADLASLSGKQPQEDILVKQASDAVQSSRALVDDQVLTGGISDRLSRACERIREMSASSTPSHGK